MGQLSWRGPLRHRGETCRVMVVSTAVARIGEGACVDELTVSGPKYHATQGDGGTSSSVSD
jgi:hypothetical protein